MTHSKQRLRHLKIKNLKRHRYFRGTKSTEKQTLNRNLAKKRLTEIKTVDRDKLNRVSDALQIHNLKRNRHLTETKLAEKQTLDTGPDT